MGVITRNKGVIGYEGDAWPFRESGTTTYTPLDS